MNPERWERVEQIYHAALDREPDQQAAYLEEACAGDDSLRKEVESLLACQDSAEGILKSPAIAPAARDVSVRDSEELTGRTLSHYRILEKIGAGGMGIVYKALDTRLNRPVVLKVLPPDTVSDPERKRRFAKEARAASALNHPNIVTIYDIGEAEGVEFIAMEYVAGKSLDQLIPSSGMRITQAIKIGIQVADGLGRAHAAGIIHRDLKPSNIMVTGDGLAKILDFGLAKLTEPESTPRREPGQLDGTLSKTEDGMIAGTAPYMSPEQAEGLSVDARGDVFAFGSVLYEMVTGRRAFQGHSLASTLAAVLKEDPKPPSQLVSGIPPGLERGIQRCLRKDVRRRWQHIGDVRVELEDLLEESESQSRPTSHTAAQVRRRWLSVACIGVVLIAAALYLWRYRMQAGLPQPQVVPLTTYEGEEWSPAFSPDGNQVAFRWNGGKGENYHIYIKAVGELHALQLTKDQASDDFPAWSPDGRYIAFRRGGAAEKAGIYLVSPLGGPERKVSDLHSWTQLSWTPDGKWLAAARTRRTETTAEDLSGIYLIPVDGGTVRRVTAPKAPLRDGHPAVSPDGTLLALARYSALYVSDVYCQPIGSDGTPQGEARRLTSQNMACDGIAWSRDGRSIIYSASKFWNMKHFLWRVEVDAGKSPSSLEFAGPYARTPAVASGKNRLAYATDRGIRDLDIWRLREGGTAEPFIASSLVDSVTEYSPDGRKISFRSDRAGETADIWIANADGSEPLQVTHENGAAGSPRWSPDGRFIVFDLQAPDGSIDLYKVNATGGPAQRLTNEPSAETLPSFSPDGQWIYFNSDRSGTNQIWRMPASGGEARQVTEHGADTGLVSRDGQTLYYTKPAPSTGLFTVSVTGGVEKQIADSIARRTFCVTRAGIYYFNRPRNDGRYELCLLDPVTLKVRILAKLDGPIFSGLAVSPDLKTVLYTRIKDPNSDLMLIENFR
jgi:eukaryotic-like serine/threonine-protein kinase